MVQLEEKILNRVYRFETKKTLSELIIRVGTIIIAIFATASFGIFVFQQLQEQQTLDLLQIFQEDVDTARMYIGEVASTLYQETPKQEFLIFVVALMCVIVFGLLFVKNFEKMRKRVLSILRYWLKIKF